MGRQEYSISYILYTFVHFHSNGWNSIEDNEYVTKNLISCEVTIV